MSIWSVLGIKETKDKDELKKAYRRMLAKTNPEDDPEGFMELRSAYEEALRLADEEDSGNQQKEDALTEKINTIYRSFFRRIDTAEWEKLFDDDEFVALDTAEEAFDKLMRFLMQYFYLPKMVWAFICDTFEIREQRKELKNKYPDDFLDYMINNATYDDIIDYSLFEGNEEEFDEYIELYYKLDAAMRRRNMEEQDELIGRIEKLDVYHPYIEISRIRNEIQKLSKTDYEIHLYNERLEAQNNQEVPAVKQPEEELDVPALMRQKEERLEAIRQKAKSLYSDFPDNISIINCCGDVEMYREDFAEAKLYYDKALTLEPDNYIVKGKQAELYYYLEEYEKSRDAYMELLKINHYDNNVRAGMIRANQGLIELHTKEIEEDPTNNKARLEMAWSYYQSYRFDESIATLNEFEPSEEQICEYNNLKGRNLLCIGETEKALECFITWKEEIERIPGEDDSKDANDKRKRYEYVNFLIGDCYLKLSDYDKAREHFDRALSREHDEIILTYEAYCELEYKSGNMEACLDACDRLLERDARSYIGYDYMSKAYYRLGFVNETISACERAMSIYPYVSFPYELEIKLLIRLDNIDAAEKVLQRFRSYDVESDSMDFAEAGIYEARDLPEDAIRKLSELADRMDVSNTDMDDPADVYYRMGIIYERKEDYDNALLSYNKALEINPAKEQVNGRIGLLYREKDELEKALKYFTREIELAPVGYYYTQRAIIHRHFDNYREAEKDFKEAIRLDGDNSFCYSRLGLICEQDARYEEALMYFDKAKTSLDRSVDNYDERIAQLVKFEARTLQSLHRFEESYNVYRNYIETYGLDADIAYDFAELMENMDRTEESIAFLTECINTLPYDGDLQLLIRHLIGIAGDEGYLDKANEAFELAIAKRPDDYMAYASMGRVLRNVGMYREAKEKYEKAIALSNGERNYYNELIELIYLCRLVKKTKNLPQLVAESVIPEEEMYNPYNILKQVKKYRVMKKYKEALKLVEDAIKHRKCASCAYERCHEAFYEKGLIYEDMKEYELAGICYREAIRICGHNGMYEERLKRIEKK